MEFIRNKNGLKILACCASCENGFRDIENLRQCRWDRKELKTHGPCDKYRMREKTMNCGAETGKVKRIEYIRFAMEWKQQEIQNQVAVNSRAGFDKIRREYEKLYGSIYIPIP